MVLDSRVYQAETYVKDYCFLINAMMRLKSNQNNNIEGSYLYKMDK